ncbi:MAG: hypothetical protein JKY27_03935 [Magnetovibrio sp.]|nr:hypothetical protein [Magnetovibrio sp.]
MRKTITAFVLMSLLSLPVLAGTTEALEEIKATVHGIKSQSLEDDALALVIIDVGADYDFMALVACRLLSKHGVENVKKVVLHDSVDTEKMLGEFVCAKTPEKK